MSRAIASALAIFVVLTGVLPVAAAEEVAQADAAAAEGVMPGELVVGWRNPERADGVARARGLTRVADLGATDHGVSATLLSTRGRPLKTVIAELKANPAVAYAEPNYLFSLPDHELEGGVASVDVSGRGEVTGVPVSDPQTGGQYSLNRMRVRDAWRRSTGGSNLIAVLDTGVQAGHPDLSGRVARGYDFVNNDTGAGDDNGHGTWVAGIIAANANDGYGIAGITWTDRILPVKIMNASGTGSTADLAAGIVWAANNGADVINMSVGGFPYSQAIQDAVNHAWGKGAVLIGAAGNNARYEKFYPASYDHVVSVSATQPEDEFSRWSSFGPKVDVSAPGSSVLTTNCTAGSCPHRDWGSHTYISGTSFATPNVAGVTALIRARYPDASASWVVNRLQSTVDDLGYAGRDDRYGRGRVNALRALGASVAAPTIASGDLLEGNNSLAEAKPIRNGRTTEVSLHPAGDQDWFAVKVPRAGRIDIRVTGVVDTRAYPWNRSGIPVDPIVELYNRYGALISRVDREWESGVELAQHSVGKATVLFVRVTNFYPSGNRTTFTVKPTFVDTVAPVATVRVPIAGALDVTQWVVPVATFNEAVQGVSSATVRLRDVGTNTIVAGSVTYDATKREVRLKPASRLRGNHQYRLELTSAITDMAGNPLPAVKTPFTTSLYAFKDIQGTPYAAEIQWLAARRLITGCGSERFCPTRYANRSATAIVLDRALNLPATGRDYFVDDEGSKYEGAYNRVAAAGLMTACEPAKFCPSSDVRRWQMASIVSRAFTLPPTSVDFFTDDEKSFEDAINRVAAAGLMDGCDATNFCPGRYVLRQELADIFHRALTD